MDGALAPIFLFVVIGGRLRLTTIHKLKEDPQLSCFLKWIQNNPQLN